jgi:hypothetical protein
LAARQAEKFIQDGQMPRNSEEPYDRKVADIQELRASLETEKPTLDDASRLVYLFKKAKEDEKAVVQAHKLLEIFNPKDKDVRIPDDEKVWQDLLARMIGDQHSKGVISYPDFHTLDNCKNDHMTLIDYMYDTNEGKFAPTPDKRPAFDKYDQDPEQALKWAKIIRSKYPDCQTLKASPNTIKALQEWAAAFKEKYSELKDLITTPEGEPKAMLAVVEDEIDFRRKIFAALDLVSSLGLTIANNLEKTPGREADAKKYREWANDALEKITRQKGNSPEILVKIAENNIIIGKLEEALNMLWEVKSKVARDSQLYFRVSRRISEVLGLLKKWDKAVEYPQGIAILIGFDAPYVKENWPEMKAFLKECYANGVACPSQLKPAIEEKSDKAAPPEGEKNPEAPAPPAAPAAAVPVAPAPAIPAAPPVEKEKAKDAGATKPAGN